MLEEFEELANHKVRSRWAQLGLFLRLIGFAFLGVVVLSLVFNALPGPMSNTTQKLAQMLFSIVLFGVPAFFYARMTFRDRPLYYLGLHPPDKKNFYILAILLLLFAFPLEGWLGILNRRIPLPHWMAVDEKAAEKQLSTLLAVKNPLDIVINLVVVAVIPGIFEEMFFRGVVQRITILLTKRPWLGIILTSAIFSFFHFEFAGFLPRMFLGILLGAAYWYSGSLWPCILAHCFFNGIQVLAVSFYPSLVNNDSNASVPWYATLLSLVLVTILLAAMRAQSTVPRPAGTKPI